MTLQLRPVTGPRLSAAAGLARVSRDHWRAVIDVGPQVSDGALAGPELAPGRGHVAAAVVTLGISRVAWPSPSLILFSPQPNTHKSTALEAA